MCKVLERVADIIRGTFCQPDAHITLDTTADDVQGWDSLSHARLLMTVEESFMIQFEPDVIALENVGEMVRAVTAKLRGNAREPNA